MSFIVVSWRMAFGNSLRVPLLSTISDDVYDTLGGVHNVRDICTAKAIIPPGDGPPTHDILRMIHDRSLGGGAVGPARPALAIGAPPPPPFLAIGAPPPPPPSVPTSVVGPERLVTAAWGQGPRNLIVPAQPLVFSPQYQMPNNQPGKFPPLAHPPVAPKMRGTCSVGTVPLAQVREFPALVPSIRPAKARPANQADGIHSPDPHAYRATVKSPPTGSAAVGRLHIVAHHMGFSRLCSPSCAACTCCREQPVRGHATSPT